MVSQRLRLWLSRFRKSFAPLPVNNELHKIRIVTSRSNMNQLTSAQVAASWRQDFTYDGKMRLRMRSDYSWNGSTWVFTGATKYVYDGMLVVQERDYNNNPTVTYTRGT